MHEGNGIANVGANWKEYGEEAGSRLDLKKLYPEIERIQTSISGIYPESANNRDASFSDKHNPSVHGFFCNMVDGQNKEKHFPKTPAEIAMAGELVAAGIVIIKPACLQHYNRAMQGCNSLSI